MNGVKGVEGRLNSYRKYKAQGDYKLPVLMKYVVVFRSLKEESKKYFDPYQEKGSIFNNWFKKEISRDDYVKMEYGFKYICPYETEEKRLSIVKSKIPSFLHYHLAAIGAPPVAKGIDYEYEIIKYKSDAQGLFKKEMN
jgi:hypothetical protein